MKKVSIIIPVYNIKDYVADCIESVISQDYRNLQIIIVDVKNAAQRLHALRGMGCVAQPRLLNYIVRDKDIAKRHFLLMPLLRKTLPPRYLLVSR